MTIPPYPLPLNSYVKVSNYQFLCKILSVTGNTIYSVKYMNGYNLVDLIAHRSISRFYPNLPYTDGQMVMVVGQPGLLKIRAISDLRESSKPTYLCGDVWAEINDIYLPCRDLK